jgi:alpha-tubulin suppressor-like RCC1 family protein
VESLQGAHFARRAILAVALVVGCYRPRLIDCVQACAADSQTCPDGMTCRDGLCTQGATCAPEVAAGDRHTCAVRAGEVFCWGYNAYGQLGIGSRQSRGADRTPLVPVDLEGRRAIGIAAGGRHTCALTSDGDPSAGAAVCWGDDSFGQLGLSDGLARGTAPGDVFDAVPLGADRAVASLAAGLYHTCALLRDGGVVCWGDNRFGQLGVGGGSAPGSTANLAFTPVALGEAARALSAGAYHTCAVLVSGAVRCWGWNDFGQVSSGDPSTGDPAASPLVTVAVPPAQAVAAGGFHSCALLQTGAVSCWGLGYAGRLGVAVDVHHPVVAPGTVVDLGPGRRARAIAAGATHTCALLDDFSVKCWGFNVDGELGLGDTSNRGDDEALGADLPRVALGGDPVSRLSVGANHSCVVQAANIKCWGLNGNSGRLGVGDTFNRGDHPSPAISAVTLVAPNL